MVVPDLAAQKWPPNSRKALTSCVHLDKNQLLSSRKLS